MRSSRAARELVCHLASLAPEARDRAVEEWLGIADGAPATPPGDHLVGYHASGIAAILRAFIEIPLRSDDVLVDLGSGLGKVALLAALLTGARACGVELQPHLVTRARASAARLGLDVLFSIDDARTGDLSGGTVFFLYAPFTGPVLRAVVDRLQVVAEQHAIVVAALGIDLPPSPWLARRELDAFWLSIYDSRGFCAPRTRRAATYEEEIVAYERET